MSLKDIIIHEIKENGPLKLSRFMTLCLMHPEYGYYKKAFPIGSQNDFITAPEISQLFGEMLGVFFVDLWQKSGNPLAFNFIEFGPGRGTLLQDMLRVFSHYPTMKTGIHFFLLESNVTLQKKQQEHLLNVSSSCQWYSTLSNLLEALPPRPTFFIGNEFLDVFPIDQYVFDNNEWMERRIAYEIQTDSFVFTSSSLSCSKREFLPPTSPLPGTIMEISEHQENFLLTFIKGLESQPYWGLFIDYGYTHGMGDSLQSLSRHSYVNPLEDPGQHDLTAHVNFGRLTYILEHHLKVPPWIFGPISQGLFLKNLGIDTRAKILTMKHPKRTSQIKTDLNRLTFENEMGNLFNVLGISNNASLSPAGF